MKVKKLTFIIVILIFSSFSFASASDSNINQITKEELTEYIEGQLIVSLENKYDFSIQSTRNSTSDPFSTMELNGFNVIDSLFNDLYTNYEFQSFSIQNQKNNLEEQLMEYIGDISLVEYPDKYDCIETAITSLENILIENGFNVNYIEPNYTVKSFEDDTTSMHINQRWYYNMINIPDAWNITTGSKDIKIAVLDTGIDYTHQSLEEIVDTELGRTYVGNDMMDDAGHGTHIAGTIASYGNISGIMKEATLIPIKVLDEDGLGSSFDVQRGIFYASSINADVINMSFGGEYYSRGIRDACNYAYSRDSVLVSATGNEGVSDFMYPASYDSVIAVGAIDANKERPNFSNYGEKLELVAPGTFIYSTIPENNYTHDSGTSIAAPQVSAIAGLMRSLDKDISSYDIRNILIETAQDIGEKYYFGYGIVDAHAALLAVNDSFEEPVEKIKGDVNGDNVIDSTDLTLMGRYILEIIDEFPHPEGKNAADINDDGVINSSDYVLLTKYLLEIIDEL
ncbi:S8 family serine peptidase [Herbivorax sp. ANBcel31]|uniref:S8 family serine peptidase n=1 Tax=Herbivorax sp. ANBcel31 TaxID=3069754 RepID=UPI0027B7675A|nr:S8 family serine peptidase [Herbivorax sp. ANBcel31]MDQ2086818.1 S8 family serine peptidase [Herbivorax sp. ANBcel31]